VSDYVEAVESGTFPADEHADTESDLDDLD